jgi:hypothetical protein
VSEEEISPYPCFSFIVLVHDEASIPELMSAAEKATPLIFARVPLRRPPGLWFRSFGSDLHAMDQTLERLRRLQSVADLTVVLPDGVEYMRDLDLDLVRAGMGEGRKMV